MGGRHPLGRFVFATFVSMSFLATLLSKGNRSIRNIRWITGLGAFACVWLVLQLLPLPPTLLDWASPSLRRLLVVQESNAFAAFGMTPWRQISVAPFATTEALALLMSYVLLLWTMLQRINNQHDVERTLRYVGLAALWMASIGLLQMGLGSERFLGVYQHPFRDFTGAAKGPFVNPNHFAHFVALGVGPLMWWFWNVLRSESKLRSSDWADSGARRMKRQLLPWVIGGSLALVLCTIALSRSRGGVLTSALGLVTCGGLLLVRTKVNAKVRRGILAAITIAFMLTGWYGMSPLTNRLATLTSSESVADVSLGRVVIWRAVLLAIPDYLAAGSGAGTHRFVYRRYFEGPSGVEFSFAENEYLQILLETGVIGLGLLLLTLVGLVAMAVKWCRSASVSRRAIGAALTGSLILSCSHAAIDFVWHIPACMTLSVCLAACLLRLPAQHQGDRSSNVKTGKSLGQRATRWSALVASSLVTLWMLLTLLPAARTHFAWEQYQHSRRLALQQRQADSSARVDQQIALLKNVVQRYPTFPAAHEHLAAALFRKFELLQSVAELDMPLSQIRMAAEPSLFDSVDQRREWLEQIFGESIHLLDDSFEHAVHAIRLSPLSSEAYGSAAETGFARMDRNNFAQELVQQGLQLDPGQWQIRLAAVFLAVQAADMDLALQHANQAFHQHPVAQQRLLQLFGANGAAFMLDRFQPTISEAEFLLQLFSQVDAPTELPVVRTYLMQQMQQQLQSETDASFQVAGYLKLHNWASQNGELEQAVSWARAALDIDSHDYRCRLAVAKSEFAAGNSPAAEPHLRWCLLRFPEDRVLNQMLEAL
ncbi:MAG: O-antigen ligase family protein [Pirellulaceae bacterium]